MTDSLNMSMRKFLKEVGVTSQRAIEKAMTEANAGDDRRYAVRMVLTIEELGLTHVVEGQVGGRQE